MADEFDIYGDDTFGSEIQSDDILGEIVGESTPHTREAKRRKKNSMPEDDLFEDFGESEVDKETKSASRSESRPPPSSSRPPASEHIQRQQTPQKVPVQSYTPSTRSSSTTDSPSSTLSRRELPVSMSSLRGIVQHPTNALYIGELAWYVNDENVKAPLVQAGVDSELKELTFFEHKVNGKSRGICFLEFTSQDAAAKAKDIYDKCEIDGKTPNASFTTSSNPFKHTPKEPVPKSQRAPQRDTRMSNSGPPMMGGNFNPMMGGGFNPAFANMGMNPYGGFNPMAAAAARGGFFDNMMGMPGGGRGGRGAVRGAGQPPQYMNRMGGRGNAMMGNANMPGNGGMYLNPAFFDQQQQGGAGNNA